METLENIFVDPSLEGRLHKAKKLVLEVELLDPEAFDPIAFKESLERSYFMDGQPALKVIDMLLTGFND